MKNRQHNTKPRLKTTEALQAKTTKAPEVEVTKSEAIGFLPGSNFGRPIARLPQRSQHKQAGYPGLEVFGGYVSEEFMQDLRGKGAIYTFEEMRKNDAIVAAMLFVAEQLIHNADVVMVPSDKSKDENKAKEAADLVKSSLFDMENTWPDILGEILTFLAFGWSFCAVWHKKRDGYNLDPEKSSRHEDGKIGWANISLRGHSSLEDWILGNEGQIRGFRQIGPPTYRPVIIPVGNAAHFRTSTEKNNPEGVSILRRAWRAWWIKKRLEETEAIGVERDLAGLPMITTPEGVDLWNSKDEHAAATLARAENIVRMVRLDKFHGLVLPFGWEFSLQTTAGQRPHNTSDIISRWDQRIAVTLLADMLLIGHERVGSFALVQSKVRLFSSALESYAARVVGVFNRHLIPRLMILNGTPQEYWPTMRFGPIETPALKDMGDYITAIAGVGVNIDEAMGLYLRDIAQLPPPKDGENAVKTEEEKLAEKEKNMELEKKFAPDPPPAFGGGKPQGKPTAKPPTSKSDSKAKEKAAKKQQEASEKAVQLARGKAMFDATRKDDLDRESRLRREVDGDR